MPKTRAVGFPLEQFVTGSRPDARHSAIHDAGRVKIGQGGGMPFARYPAVKSAAKVKIGGGGGMPFARY